MAALILANTEATNVTFAGTIIRYNNLYHSAGYSLGSGSGFGINLVGLSGHSVDAYQIYYNVISVQRAALYINKYSTNTAIYNNSLKSNLGMGIYISDTGTSGIIIKNNVVAGAGLYALKVVNKNSISALDYNLWYAPTGMAYANINGANYTSSGFAAYKTATGWDAHGLWQSPLITSTSIPDFHLQSSSPAINAGVNVSLITDYAGTSVPKGSAPDMGAYEYQDVILSPTPTSTPVGTFLMQTGYYMGDRTDNRIITGVGFQPELLFIKDDTDNGAHGVIWKSSSVIGEASVLLGEAAADIATDAIQSLDSNGFTLGTNVDVNGANVRFTWVAFRGSDCTNSGTFCVGSYTGDGATTRTLTSIGFQPDMVAVKRSGASAGVFRTSSMPVNVTQLFNASSEIINGTRLKTLDNTGFTVGDDPQVNANGDIYRFFAFKNTSNAFAVGTYIGNGVDNRTITGIGFRPQYLWDKITTNGASSVFNVIESNGNHSGVATDTTNSIGLIKSLNSDGFTLGTGTPVNGSGSNYYWFAFGGATNPTASGTYTMKVGSYIGNGTSQLITGTGFAPDLIMVKDQLGTNYEVFRTQLMKGNTTAYLANAAPNFTGGITSLDSDGFSVGASATVNTNGTTYHYQAFGNAFNPEKNTGAADFAVGAYTGSYGDNRNIVRVPFQPDLVTIKGEGLVLGVWRTSAVNGDLSIPFNASVEAANYIQALNSDGFQIGSDGRVNVINKVNNWFAFKASSTMTVNNYTGTGNVQNITIPGFSPSLVWVKNIGAIAGVFRPSTILGNLTTFFNNTAAVSDRITGFVSNGFSLGGNQIQTNTNGTTYRYAAWKTP